MDHPPTNKKLEELNEIRARLLEEKGGPIDITASPDEQKSKLREERVRVVQEQVDRIKAAISRGGTDAALGEIDKLIEETQAGEGATSAPGVKPGEKHWIDDIELNADPYADAESIPETPEVATAASLEWTEEDARKLEEITVKFAALTIVKGLLDEGIKSPAIAGDAEKRAELMKRQARFLEEETRLRHEREKLLAKRDDSPTIGVPRGPYIDDVPPSAPQPIPPLGTPEEEKQVAIDKLKETIAVATERLAEIDQLLDIDSLQHKLALKRKEHIKKKGHWGTKKRKEEIASLEKRLDKMQNPFKYYLIGRMSRKNFRIMFGVNKENATVGDIDGIMGETGRNFEKGYVFETTQKIFDTEDVVECTPNGFYLKLTNKKEVKDKTGIKIGDPKARYDLYNEFGDIIAHDLNFATAEDLLRQKAKEYQAQEIALFESLNKKS